MIAQGSYTKNVETTANPSGDESCPAKPLFKPLPTTPEGWREFAALIDLDLLAQTISEAGHTALEEQSNPDSSSACDAHRQPILSSV